MDLAEKIMIQRKRQGWSQEDLADRLDISRQSVSKWESGLSVPELDKLIRMSQLFGVTTDYLLTDRDSAPVPASEPQRRTVGQSEAYSFLDRSRRAAKSMAPAVAALILSPTPLILMGGLSEYMPGSLSENMAGGMGVAILLVIVAAAVAVLIQAGMKLKPYEYLETECIALQPGLEEILRQRQQDFAPVFQRCIIAGVTLCILSVVPMMAAAAFDAGDLVYVVCTDVLLAFLAVAVCLFVWSGTIHGAFQKLLQEEEYTPAEKQRNRRLGGLSGIYWCIATAVYLGVSFLTSRWDMTWIVWPCAGVLFAAVLGIARAVTREKD